MESGGGSTTSISLSCVAVDVEAAEPKKDMVVESKVSTTRLNTSHAQPSTKRVSVPGSVPNTRVLMKISL